MQSTTTTTAVADILVNLHLNQLGLYLVNGDEEIAISEQTRTTTTGKYH